jgi:putative transposase
MPRTARVKNFDYIYHIMVRSISDTPLFKDTKDKDKYLNLLAKYQKKIKFKVYSYCLMTTHAHLILDCNGADISKIMHGINQSYAQYFNIKYKRHGHLFQDRFKSKVVSNTQYLLTLSAYIHNNPTDIKKYKNCPEKFKYSTLSVYLGLSVDYFGIIDEQFILGLINENIKKARESYFSFVKSCNKIEKKAETDFEFKNEGSQYRSERTVLKREHTPETILAFVAKYTGVDKNLLHMKHRRNATDGRALSVLFLRCFCDFNYRQICSVLGNLTLSRISALCSIGINIVDSKECYNGILDVFLKEQAI